MWPCGGNEARGEVRRRASWSAQQTGTQGFRKSESGLIHMNARRGIYERPSKSERQRVRNTVYSTRPRQDQEFSLTGDALGLRHWHNGQRPLTVLTSSRRDMKVYVTRRAAVHNLSTSHPAGGTVLEVSLSIAYATKWPTTTSLPSSLRSSILSTDVPCGIPVPRDCIAPSWRLAMLVSYTEANSTVLLMLLSTDHPSHEFGVSEKLILEYPNHIHHDTLGRGDYWSSGIDAKPDFRGLG